MLAACNQPIETVDEIRFQQQLDSMASVSIDAAYKVVLIECEEKKRRMVPKLIDSILKADTVGR